MKNTLVKMRSQYRLALNSLLNAPGFVSSVLVTISLTLATLFVVLSLVNTYFVKPLNVLNEKKLYVIEQEVDTPSGTHAGFQSYKSIIHWFKSQNSLDKVAAISPGNFIVTSLPGEPRVVATYATTDYFELLKVPVLLGQKFSSDLAMDFASDNVMISEAFWQKYFNRDPNVIGQTIQEGPRTYKISGVVDGSYQSPYMFYQGESDLWFNFGSDSRFFNDGEFDNPWDNTYRSLKMVGTAKQGFSQQDIYQDLDARIEDIRAEWLKGYPTSTDFRPLVIPYRIAELGDKGHLSLFLLAGTLGLLAIAVVNVCNLFFSRALAQHKTLALQAVLGAKRKLLFSSILTQTSLLMAAAFAVALFASAWGIKLFKFLADGKLPLVGSVGIDTNLVIAAVIICALLAYLFALITSRLINYQQLKQQLQASGKGAVNQISGRTVKVLVGLQMALASVLIIFACLALTRTLQTLDRPMGSKTVNMFAVTAFIRDENSELSMAERVDKREQVRQKLEQHAQIKKVTVGRSPVSERITRSNLTDMNGVQTGFLPQAWVGPDYFEHTGLKILHGRTFSDAAIRGEKPEMLVTQSLAYQLATNGDVIGKVYDGHDPKVEIVGVTEDFNHPNYYHQDKGAHIWWADQAFGYQYIIETHPGQVVDQAFLLTALRKEDARFNIWEFKSLDAELGRILYMDKITLYVSYILASFTLLLASVGIYGVLSYNLGLRRFEFGLRMALGAKSGRLYKLLISEALLPLVLGLSLAILVTYIIYIRFTEALSLWLSFDPKLAIVALLVTVLVALVASFRPMQKVIKSRPMAALRNE